MQVHNTKKLDSNCRDVHQHFSGRLRGAICEPSHITALSASIGCYQMCLKNSYGTTFTHSKFRRPRDVRHPYFAHTTSVTYREDMQGNICTFIIGVFCVLTLTFVKIRSRSVVESFFPTSLQSCRRVTKRARAH